MTRRRLAPALGALAATLAAVAATAVAASGGQQVGAAATKKITASGVGAVKVGMTYRELRAAGLVGRLRKGCPLEGPKARFARLRAPLRGSADFTTSSPRRVRTISVLRGATARGVAVGDREEEVRAAFPNARFDHSTDETFDITVVRVPKRDGGKLQLALNARTGVVELIAVPQIPFCE